MRRCSQGDGCLTGDAHKEALMRRCSRGACEAMLVRRCWTDVKYWVGCMIQAESQKTPKCCKTKQNAILK